MWTDKKKQKTGLKSTKIIVQQQVCGTEDKTCNTMLYSSSNKALSLVIIVKTLEGFSHIFHLPTPVQC